MLASMIDDRVLGAPEAQLAAFRHNRPSPWLLFPSFLEDTAFEELRRTFPARQLFELQKGIRRPGKQRPHDRFYLAFESRSHRARARREHPDQGLVAYETLAEPWQRFLDELRSEAYERFLTTLFGRPPELRFAWHISFRGSEVSPHLDSRRKLGTHIFYFNGDDDWREEWGGQTLMLADKQTPRPNPDFSDFGEVITPPMLGNHSLLFQRTDDSWHGVERLSCPEDAYRRTFHVIASEPSHEPS